MAFVADRNEVIVKVDGGTVSGSPFTLKGEGLSPSFRRRTLIPLVDVFFVEYALEYFSRLLEDIKRHGNSSRDPAAGK